MDTSSPFKESVIEALEVSSTTSSSIHVGWHIRDATLPFIRGYRVHYQKVASTYIQYGPELEPTDNEYEIRNLVADTYYKVCLVVYRNTSSDRECVDESTTNWQLPVSIGSSIGAVLALSMIVLIVLLSRCQIPIQYKRKRRNNSSRYDTMSSNYHDDHYEFSETVTHGNEDDYPSEYDHDDDGLCEISSNEQTKPKHIERMSIPNGLCKNHVHPHVYQHQQHRNSLGRVYCPSSHAAHHHARPTRAFSINSSDAHSAYINQHLQCLRKDSIKLPVAKECHEIEDSFSLKLSEKGRKPAHIHKEPSLKKDLLKHDLDLKQRPPLLSQQSTQGFSYIDETQEESPKESNAHLSDDTASNVGTVHTDRVLIDDIKFDDLSAFGAAGGIKESFLGQAPVRHWDANKPVEMSYKQNVLGLGDSASFEEHAL